MEIVWVFPHSYLKPGPEAINWSRESPWHMHIAVILLVIVLIRENKSFLQKWQFHPPRWSLLARYMLHVYLTCWKEQKKGNWGIFHIDWIDGWNRICLEWWLEIVLLPLALVSNLIEKGTPRLLKRQIKRLFWENHVKYMYFPHVPWDLPNTKKKKKML